MWRTAVALLAIAAARAQSTPPVEKTPLKFEVATIKPSQDTGDGPVGIRPAPGGERYIAFHVPLKLMIAVAYRLRPEQVIGGPAWVGMDLYDMNAKAERPSSMEDLHGMLQQLLAERFQLRLDRGSKEMSIYALTVDPGGPKLVPHAGRNGGDPWIDNTANPFPHMVWHAKFAPMDFLAWRLSLILDRPVTDQTNLKGGYDFDLSFTQDLPPGIQPGALLNGAVIDTSGPTIFEALRKQLGLKLEARKGPAETLAIEHAEKPADN
jgi:uncharacterized protein (TIGR03435 family)